LNSKEVPAWLPEGSANARGIKTVTAKKVSELEKNAAILEIIGLLEQSHMGKEWVAEQLRLKRQKVPVNPAMTIVDLLRSCDHDFIFYLRELLKAKEEGIDAPPALTRTYHWFFTDIVGSSDPTMAANEQVSKIIALNKIVERTETFRQRDPETTLVLPTGDGMAIGFADSAEKPFMLAFEVHKALYDFNKARKQKDRVKIRIGLDTGPVYLVKVINGNENVFGPGIVMARRVMDLAREMNILASSRFATDVKNLRPEYRRYMHEAGDYDIKHGEKVFIYNIYDGKEIGSKKAPDPDKKQKSPDSDGFSPAASRFLFNHIGLELEVKDVKTMLTHHVYDWNVINVSDKPVERIFYYIDGDVPRSFPDLNVTVKDEDGRELEILSLNANKPYHKAFFVKASRPIKPKEKGRMLRMEFDWEEPDRHFVYDFASDCKKFDYLLKVPKGMEINQKVVKINKMSGDMILASTPAAVQYLPDKTLVTWSAKNLKTFDTYRFDW
jgi:class 3 adenylate cyclase